VGGAEDCNSDPFMRAPGLFGATFTGVESA
jgi:hypothetical protein